MSVIAELSGQTAGVVSSVEMGIEAGYNSNDSASAAFTERSITLSFPNGNGQTVNATFKIQSSGGVNTNHLWAAGDGKKLKVTVEAIEP